MLHLRALCPPDRTDEVIGALQEHNGAAHVVCHRGAAMVPDGDLVEADIAREAADEVISTLCALNIDHTGGITLEQLDSTFSDAADQAEERAPGDAADAVVWQALVGQTGDESRLTFTYQAFLSIACLLAAVGVITDSPITIVGAMVLGPEFGPLAAVSVGLVLKRRDLLRRGAAALLIGFPLAIAITAALTLLGHVTGMFEATALSGDHQVDFVYEVGAWSLIAALLAGAAGMLSMMSTKSAALVGVFISVTTVPAASYASVAAVLGDWERCAGSLAQLAVNLVGIVVAASAVLWARKRGNNLGADRPLSMG